MNNLHVELQDIVTPFPVAEKSLLKQRDLLRRVDTKFVAPADMLGSIFHSLESSYSRVLANGASWATYETLYFDTPGEQFYNDHRRGCLGRYKVRIRRYPDRHLNYFEVKLKSNRRITTKLRRLKTFDCSTLEAKDLALAAQVPSLPTKVVPRLWTMFYRLQLVGQEHVERITIDLGVSFRHGKNGSSADFDDLASQIGNSHFLEHYGADLRSLAIVEVKQPRFQSRTPIMLALRRAGVRQRRLSKYCTGVVLTNATTRAHRFMPNLKQIARLQCSSS